MRICIVYDCLFPHTVGGAERWYRNVAETLAAEGHAVTYITMRQWPRGSDPGVEGVDVRAVGPRIGLYTESGRRKVHQAVVFGLGVLWFLLRHGRRFDVVHTCSFPYFSVLAAALVRPLARYRLVVDWFEVWSRSYWMDYLGGAGGRVGWLVQRLCALVPQRAYCFSRLHAARLRDAGLRSDPVVLEGAYTGSAAGEPPMPAEPFVLFAGRHIPEKNVPALVRAMALLPGLRAEILGDGPERAEVERLARAYGERVAVRGFVSSEEVEDRLRRALCMVLPSRREGYGMVVIEAASHGTPSVVVAAPDNAAVELVAEGVNGFVAASDAPADIAAAVQRVAEAGPALRESTAAWWAANAERLSMGSSLDAVAAGYAAR
jgi:glycosyltransferase involved in cell wall biosynthesis